MLRIKRSVQATYNVQVNFMSAQMIAASINSTERSSEANNDSQGMLEHIKND
jgi:pre-mRNA-splicing factor SYF1